MNGYNMENIRNIAVMGHGKCGKSSIIEAMLYNSGAINRIGKNLDGTLVSDYDTEEIKRQILGSYNQCCRHYIACSIDCSFVFAINKIVFQ